MSDPKPRILPAPNGPLIIEGLTDLRDAEGEIECQPKMALCRCGSSSSKPFCDGSHAKVGFSSTKSPGGADDKVDSYVGKKLTIHDNRSICAHASRCTDGMPEVWRLQQEPWIDPDGAKVADIVEVIESCPSGALSYTISDGSTDPAAPPPLEATVFIAKGGPYAVSGPVALDGETFGAGAQHEQFTLCRCGASKNKPFCDGTHWNVPFDE